CAAVIAPLNDGTMVTLFVGRILSSNTPDRRRLGLGRDLRLHRHLLPVPHSASLVDYASARPHPSQSYSRSTRRVSGVRRTSKINNQAGGVHPHCTSWLNITRRYP
ncbi:hypothetical protein FRC09_017006, partial [Ceratobasidium sp. 395]